MDFTDEDARALSVRQPWAWAIVSGYKDVENRSQGFVDVIAPRALGKTIFIHASKHFVKSEFDNAVETMARLGIGCPATDELPFGGVIGTAKVVEIVRRSRSPWFHGRCGLVLAEAKPCRFLPAKGQVGLFRIKRAE